MSKKSHDSKPTNASDDRYADGKALGGRSDTTRRAFLRNTTAAGLVGSFAVAARPIQAQQVISTDFNGLDTGEAGIAENGIELYAYYAKPKDAKGPLPTVIVCSEIFGVHEYHWRFWACWPLTGVCRSCSRHKSRRGLKRVPPRLNQSSHPQPAWRSNASDDHREFHQ